MAAYHEFVLKEYFFIFKKLIEYIEFNDRNAVDRQLLARKEARRARRVGMRPALGHSSLLPDLVSNNGHGDRH